MNWEIVKFGDVVEFPPKIKLLKGNRYSFVPMELLIPGQKYVSDNYKSEWKGSGGAKFENGDTLFARITPCLQNGKISQAINLETGVGFGSTEYFVFRGKQGITDSDFVYYLSLDESFRKYAIGSMVGASGRQRADAEFVSQYEFRLPPLRTQIKISNILSAYDKLIENNLKRIALLEQAGQNIYEEWFVNMRFPGFEGKSIDRDTGRLNGWRRLRFDEVFEVQNGYAFKSEDYSDSGIQVLRTKDYSSSFFIKNTEHQFLPTEFEKLYRKYLVKELDLMLIMVGASIGRLGLVLDKDIPLLQNQNQWAIRAKREFSSFEHYKIFYVQSIVESLLMKRTGAARDFFRASFLKEMEILLPPEKLIKEFTDIVSPLFSQINVLLKLNKEYSTARNILLPRLMNQTIKV